MPRKEADAEETASQRSGTSGGDSESQTSSHQSTIKYLRHERFGADREEGDLLEQRRSVQDGIFSCMYTLVRQSALNSWKFAVLKIVMEFLMFFIVAFNPTYPQWEINTSNPIWQVIRWAVWRSPIMYLYGYHTYIVVLYIMAAAVYLAVAGLAWLTVAMRAQEHSKWLRRAALGLHIVYDIMFFICYVSFFDYFIYVANCDFFGKVKRHMQFEGVMCLEMPHLIHLLVGLFTAAVFLSVTALMVVASSDLNPVSQGYMASPAVYPRLKILLAKAAFVISAADLDAALSAQAVINVVTVALICWWNYRSLPFYRAPVNIVWCGQWIGILYATLLLIMMLHSKDQSYEYLRHYTMVLLYGIFPAVAGGIALAAVRVWWAMRPAGKFRNLEAGVKLSKVYKFRSMDQVGLLARVTRKFDVDGVVDPAAGNWGEAVIKAGMQTYPDSPHLFLLYANFLLEVRKDGPASRTQLQLASKHLPSLVDRYQIFCTGEASKRLKDSQDGGMDLQAYIEFRRNFRAVLRVHKEVLLLQNELWGMMLRSSLRVAQVDKALDSLEASTAQAHQVYKRVLERYPTNGKLLRCYGKFLEDVKHDPPAATRVYTEANRNGGGDAIMNLDLSRVQSAVDKPDFLTSLSIEDDAVIVINAEGIIMMVSQAVQPVFGYPKAELEGANVSLLMPQPFCQRHDSYLKHYVGGGEPRILDTVREVVALHKERYAFPMALCVTKMSGTADDSIFLGVCRPLPANSLTTRAWLAPNGTFMCGDQQFASLCGVMEGDLVGRTLASMVADPDVVIEQLLERCQNASALDLQSGSISEHLLIKHRYLDSTSVHATIGLAGTDTQRILVLNCTRDDGEEGNMLVVDSHMKIRFASCGLTTLLGFPMRKLISMRLDQLLPPPYNTLHCKHLRDPPSDIAPTSCRSGKVVHLLNENGGNVPVRLKIQTLPASDTGTTFVIQVAKVAPGELFNEKRLVVTAEFGGRVVSVSQPDSDLFGFRAEDMVGCSLCDSIDIFQEWRERAGETQMQLLILALLDKEHEMPGTSWRVRVHQPATEGAPYLPDVAGAKPLAGPKRVTTRSACLQVELNEADGGIDDDGSKASLRLGALSDVPDTHVRVTLWRRDLLTGVVELDEDLVVRRASPMTGLIVGMPSTAMLKKPIQRFLDVPPDMSWGKLAESHMRHKRRGGLKGDAQLGKVSPPMAFIGPHPDTGSMRIVIQGVQVLAPGGRSKVTVTLHPDTTFAGAHADLMRVLHLDAAHRQQSQKAAAKLQDGISFRAVEAGAGGGASQDEEDDGAPQVLAEPPASQQASETAGALEGGEGQEDDAESRSEGEGSVGSKERGAAGDGARDLEAEGQAKLLGRAASKSDFVAQWVRTLTKRRSGAQDQEAQGPQPPDQQPLEPRPGSSAGAPPLPGPPPATPPAAGLRGAANALGAIPEDEEAPAGLLEAAKAAPFLDPSQSKRTPQSHLSAPAKSGGLAGGPGSRQSSRDIASPPTAGRADDEKGNGGREPGAEDAGAGGRGEKWEKGSDGESSADGSQAASGISSATGAGSVNEVMLDSRRVKLLKTLEKLLLGPMLMIPLDRLRLHNYGLLAVMLICHVACFVIVSREIAAEDHEIYLVYRQALAMDRSQLIAVRAMMGAFCERDNVTAKVSVCANSLSYTVGKLSENVDLMESHHQYVYLGGSSSSTTKLMPQVFDVWTARQLEYHTYMDTEPPRVGSEQAGVWQLGSRYLAAAREALYWLPVIGANYRLHRTFQFLVTNGLGPLFTGYATSLDLLVDSAWKSVDQLKITIIALLVVEAMVIQLSCLLYEWYLVQQLETARLVGILAMYGLPAPVLRQLASKEVKVLDDGGDDGDEDDGSDGDDEQRAAGGRDSSSAVATTAGGAAAAAGKEAGSTPVASKQATAMGEHAEADSIEGADEAVAAIAYDKPGPAKSRNGAQDGGIAATSALGGPGGRTAFKLQADGGAPAPVEGGPGAAGFEDGGGRRVSITGATHTKTRSSKAQVRRSTDGQGGSKLRFWRARGLQMNGKLLIPSSANLAWFLIPFALWNIGIMVVYAVSLLELEGMQGPLASLNMASHIIYRYTRVRAIAFGVVSQDDTVSRSLWRDMLSNELRLFESEYDALMYGGVPLTHTATVFNHPVPAGTFASSSFANEFFRSKRCFRYVQDECLEPGDEYYEVTRNGLDVMVRRMISEMTLLTEDADEDVAYNGTRYVYMFRVGGRDLYEGLQQAAQLFVDYSINHYHRVANLHTILLCATLILAVLYIVGIVWPHLARVKNDASRQSALLSHVPPEVDLKSHVRAVFKRAQAARTRRGRGSSSYPGAMADGVASLPVAPAAAVP